MTDRPPFRFLPRRWIHFARSRPRLSIGAALGILIVVLAPPSLSGPTRGLVAWDAGGGTYLVLAWLMMLRATQERMRWRARIQDDGAVAVLSITVVASVASLAAIILELIGSKQANSHREWHLALAGATILVSWLVVHTTFALHYAHEYFTQHARDGTEALQFPGGGVPEYVDFLYFSFVIGATSQTADISIAAPRMRRFALLHCIVAFFFNTTLLALTINIAAGLM